MIKKHAINAVRDFQLAFTILMIWHLIFSCLGIWSELSNERVLQILIICFIVDFLQFLTTFLPIESVYLDLLVRFVEMCLIVFLLGGKVFHMFQYSLKNIISIGCMVMVVFLIVCLFTFYSYIKETRRINEIIKKKKK